MMSGVLGWVLLGSVSVHVAVVVLLPRAPRGPTAPPSIAMIELATESPPPPPPPPPPSEPSLRVEPTSVAAPRADTRARVSPESAPRSPDQAAPATAREAAEDAPLDFTATPLSNDADGVAIGSSGRDGGKVGSPARAAPTPPSASTRELVPLGSLSRPPRAPALDAELERNYPSSARASGVSGKAVVKVEILHDGRVGRAVTVSESFVGFAEACMKTVRAARWEPPIDREGRRVATEITYVCRFEVRR